MGPHGTDITRNMARFACEFRLEDAPEGVAENAKNAILDCLGVSVAASAHDMGRVARSFAAEAVAPGACSVWGTGIKAGPRDAALLNGMLAHGLDFDDLNHSTTYLLAASFAVAEAYGLPGRGLLEAMIVGREVRYVLDGIFADRHAGIGPGARGWHPTGALGSFAAAAAVSRALDLDLAGTTAAIGLGAGSCGALMRDGGTMAKPYRPGHVASAGIVAALLAKHGATADDAIIEGNTGLLDAIGIPEGMAVATGSDLGRTFNLATPIKAKKYPSAAAAHAPLEALLRLRETHRLTPEAIDRIELDLRSKTALRDYPETGFEGLFSLRFCMAAGFVHGGLGPAQFSTACVNDPAVRETMRRIDDVPGSPAVAVVLKTGERLVEPLGERPSLSTRQEIEDKFRRCTEGILPPAQVEAAIKAVGELENAHSIRDLAEAVTLRPLEAEGEPRAAQGSGPF